MTDLFGISHDKNPHKRSRSGSASSVSSVETATSDMGSDTIEELQQKQADYATATTHYMKTNLTDLNSPIAYDNNKIVPPNSLFNFIRVSDHDRIRTHKNRLTTYRLVRDKDGNPSHFVPFSESNSDIQENSTSSALTSSALDLHNAGIEYPPSGTTDSDPDTLIGGKRRKSKKTKTSKKSRKARKTKGVKNTKTSKKSKLKKNKSSRHSKHK